MNRFGKATEKRLKEVISAADRTRLEADGWRRSRGDGLWRNDRFGGAFKTQNALKRVGSKRGEVTQNKFQCEGSRPSDRYGDHYHQCQEQAGWQLSLPDSNSAANIAFFCTEHVLEAVQGLLEQDQGVCVERLEVE